MKGVASSRGHISAAFRFGRKNREAQHITNKITVPCKLMPWPPALVDRRKVKTSSKPGSWVIGHQLQAQVHKEGGGGFAAAKKKASKSQSHYIAHSGSKRHSRVALLKVSMSGCRSSDAVDPLRLNNFCISRLFVLYRERKREEAITERTTTIQALMRPIPIDKMVMDNVQNLMCRYTKCLRKGSRNKIIVLLP